MIQSILFFVLGFLCAGFLALMVAPAIWRRAVALTRRRIEASVPLTLTDIQADKDRMRAEFAMSTRRLEMSVKSFREKAAAQIVDINKGREELKALAADRDRQNEANSQLEARAAELRQELRQREDQLQRAAEKLADAERAVEQRTHDMERLSGLYEEARLASSSRQVELVARDSEVERLSTDVTALRNERKDAERRYQEMLGESRMARETLRAEKKRAGDIEAKLERMMSMLADRDEKIDRNDKELIRLRQQVRDAGRTENELNGKLVELQGEHLRLESEHANLTLQMSRLLSTAKGEDVEKAVAKLAEEREQMQERLDAVSRENAKFKRDLAASERAKAEDWSDERKASALLREQMNDLAAEVISLTAMLDGPQSPIAKALAKPPALPRPVNDRGEKVTSLADRVLALQQRAAK